MSTRIGCLSTIPYIFIGVISIAVFMVGIGNTLAQTTAKKKSHCMCIKPKIYTIQINVTDLEKATDFYRNLGFETITREYLPYVAPMINEETRLTLFKVAKLTSTDPDGVRTTLNMLVKNLDETIDMFEKKGIAIIHDKPQDAAIGKWKAICDPFGNIINLIEPNRDVRDLDKPKVNNVSIVGTDIDQAVHFYGNILGLDIFSVKYYPVIPLSVEGVVDNIALHATAEKNVEKVYPDGTQTFLVFEVEDLNATMQYLKSKGVELLHEVPQKAAPGIYVAFKDPFGLVHELLELNK